MSEDQNLNPEASDEKAQMAMRRQKLAELRQSQKTAYPNDFKPTIVAACLHHQYDEKSKEDLESVKDSYKVAGRIMLRRVMGKASFITIQDLSGRIQAYVRGDALPEGVYEDFKTWDLGDIVGVEGTVFKTKMGELSIHATNIRLLTKSLRPMPDKFHGLADQELRYRRRYVDLMVNEDSRRVFQTRSKVIAAVRHFLIEHKFMEVETPMLHTIAGGAAAKPFKTFHNSLDLDMFLRIAPELFLKRLVVGGFERVFEINRSFRNEGLSIRHNPEFTMLEFYQAYATYEDLMDLTEELLRTVVSEVHGAPKLQYQGHDFDFSKPFKRVTLFNSILELNPNIKAEDLQDREKAAAVAKKLEIPIEKCYGLGKIQVEIFEKTVEHKLMEPTFITEYPAEVSPLARCNDDNPFITDRFEFFVSGREIANGFSELNDPEDQDARFKAQVEAKSQGDEEAMPYDEDYIRALEYGMPPAAGEGIGIDRLVMLLTDMPSIRDVLLFPHMRPE